MGSTLLRDLALSEGDVLHDSVMPDDKVIKKARPSGRVVRHVIAFVYATKKLYERA